MKYLIVGLGSIGRRHLRNLSALGEREITLYRTHHSTLPEEDLAGYAVETDLTRALAQHPDGVVIANPTSLHLDAAIPAARAGSHLLLEKPISANMDRVEEFSTAVQESGSRVLVGFQFRFHPTLQLARQLITEGALGRVVSAQAHWAEYLPGWHPWEDHRIGYAARKDLGGGVVLTLCHPLDYLRWMFGEVESLQAYTAAAPEEIGTDVDAVADIAMQFAGGVQAAVHLDYLQRPVSHTLDVSGTQGLLRWDNTTAELKLYRVSTGEWETFSPPSGFERNWLFIEEMKAFLTLVRGQAESPCTLADGIAAQRLVMGVYCSASEGRRVKIL